MKFLVCLLVTLGVAYGAVLPLKPNCAAVFCTMDLKICPDGTPAPVPVGGCCPSLTACKTAAKPATNCANTFCTMDLKICPDGTPAPVPVGGCCPSLTACKTAVKRATNCANTFCTMDLKICPDGTRAPVPVGECCPSLTACKTAAKPAINCAAAFCILDFKVCPDGTPAPVAEGECCPSLKACKTHTVGRRSNPLGSLGSLLSGGNVLQTLSTATHGTDLGTALSILKLLNNVQQLSNDVHQIPLLINQTLASLVNGTGQASQIILDQLVGAVSSATHQNSGSRDLLSSLGSVGSNLGLLNSITHALPAGTSISTVLSILKLLNSVNQLNNDVHQIPVLLNQTLASIVNGTGQASQIVLNQLLGLVGHQSQGTSRDLLSSLGSVGSNLGLLNSITHALPAGTSISTVLSILKLLNSVNQLNNDVHQIPVLLNQTLASIVNGTGQASQIVLNQLLGLVGHQSQGTSRDLLGALGQHANLLSTVSNLLPQGTSITTVLSLLKFLNNVNGLNHDLQSIPAVLQETLQNLLNGVQNLLPPTIQPVQGSA